MVLISLSCTCRIMNPRMGSAPRSMACCTDMAPPKARRAGSGPRRSGGRSSRCCKALSGLGAFQDHRALGRGGDQIVLLVEPEEADVHLVAQADGLDQLQPPRFAGAPRQGPG